MSGFIIRSDHRDRFTVIDNRALRDERLSWAAIGMLAYLLSLPDNWRVNLTDLANRTRSGMHATRTTMRELEEHGYIEKRKVREGGRIIAHEIVVREVAHHNAVFPLMEIPTNGKPTNGKPHAKKDPGKKDPGEEVPILDGLKRAIVEATGGNVDEVPKSRWPQINRIAVELRDVGATPDEIQARVQAYRRKMPDAACTPEALLKWWGTLGESVPRRVEERRIW